MLHNKNILLGVSGGIAIYKSVDLVSKLRKKGCNVKVIMTESATKFVTPLVFREISGNPVAVSMWNEVLEYNIEHIALASWADVVIIAPATANIIAKITNGIADDMLSTTILATKAPIMLFPAMNTNMYENPVTTKNLQQAKNIGMTVIEPNAGDLACGVVGKGRLPEPVEIIKHLEAFLTEKKLAGLKVLVTAGGTREPIDPVRYIGNRSSGKMGYAIAEEAANSGARVILISANTSLEKPFGVDVRCVETAEEMRQLVLQEYPDADIVIKAAAVSDYKVKNIADKKIKKNEEKLSIELVKNPDILKELGDKKTNQFLIGFAAETNDLISNAMKKIKFKNLDMIVANDVSMPEAGFNYDTNIVNFIYPDKTVVAHEKLFKKDVAKKIIDAVFESIKK